MPPPGCGPICGTPVPGDEPRSRYLRVLSHSLAESLAGSISWPDLTWRVRLNSMNPGYASDISRGRSDTGHQPARVRRGLMRGRGRDPRDRSGRHHRFEGTRLRGHRLLGAGDRRAAARGPDGAHPRSRWTWFVAAGVAVVPFVGYVLSRGPARDCPATPTTRATGSNRSACPASWRRPSCSSWPRSSSSVAHDGVPAISGYDQLRL